MADIVLTHSFLLDSDPKQKRIGQPLAPLGTLYAASVLRGSECSIVFSDSMFMKSADQLIPILQKEKPRILVIYEDGFSYLTKMCLASMRKAALRMIEIGHLFGAKVIINSYDATDNYQLYLENNADIILLGEAELTLKELVIRMLNGPGNEYDDISGLAFSRDGKLVITKPRPIMESLDDLPFPAWDLLDAEAYRTFWKSKNNSFSLNMVTTRGCPYNCIWCAKPIYGNHCNTRSPLNVVKEMIYLQNLHSPEQIWFADDIFGLKPGWVKEFAKQLSFHNLIIPFIVQSRVDILLENDQVQSLVKAGCIKIWLGIESGSQKILDAMQKGITVEQIRSVSPILRKSGIMQAFFLQLGFPGEKKDDINKTIKLLTDLMPDDIGISVTYPLPGTKFYDAVKKTMEIRSNWKDSDELSLLFKSTYSAQYYKLLHRYIHKYYRFRQSLFIGNKILRKLSIPTHNELRRVVLLPWYLCSSLVIKSFLILKKNDWKSSI